MDIASPIMLHSTYFKLKEGKNAAVRAAYMAACREYLSGSKGMMSFWVSELAQDMKRPENDRDYDIAMNQVFQNKSMFDLYNGHDPLHEQFVAEVNRWAPGTTRRVQDAYLDTLRYSADGPSSGTPASSKKGGPPPRLMHSIYFALTDKSGAAKAQFSEICLRYLSDHPGICMFALGGLADMGRDVSVTNYDVAMSIIWRSKPFYDGYLKSKDHDAFFPATKGMIANTYIFDSYIQPDPNA